MNLNIDIATQILEKLDVLTFYNLSQFNEVFYKASFISHPQITELDNIKDIPKRLHKYIEVELKKTIVYCGNYKHVRSLKLHDCILRGKFKYLRNLQEIHIDNINIKDISMLCGIQSVTIESCIHVDDVSPLKYAKKVKLIDCNNVEDISPLCNVKDVTLFICDLIFDVSSLCNVEVLTIICCENITSIGPSNVLRELTLHKSDVVNLIGLVNVKKLTMISINTLTDMSPLINLEELRFYCYIHRMPDFSNNNNIKVIEMIECNYIPSIPIGWKFEFIFRYNILHKMIRL